MACLGYSDGNFGLGTQTLKLKYKSLKLTQQVLIITKMLAINTVNVININIKVLKHTAIYICTHICIPICHILLTFCHCDKMPEKNCLMGGKIILAHSCRDFSLCSLGLLLWGFIDTVYHDGTMLRVKLLLTSWQPKKERRERGDRIQGTSVSFKDMAWLPNFLLLSLFTTGFTSGKRILVYRSLGEI